MPKSPKTVEKAPKSSKKGGKVVDKRRRSDPVPTAKEKAAALKKAKASKEFVATRKMLRSQDGGDEIPSGKKISKRKATAELSEKDDEEEDDEVVQDDEEDDESGKHLSIYDSKSSFHRRSRFSSSGITKSGETASLRDDEEEDEDEEGDGDNAHLNQFKHNLIEEVNHVLKSQPSNRKMQATEKAVLLLECEYRSIVKFEEFIIRNVTLDINRNECISKEACEMIDLCFESARVANFADWRSFDDEKLFALLRVHFPVRNGLAPNTAATAETQLRLIKFAHYHVLDDANAQDYIMKTKEVIKRVPEAELNAKRVGQMLKILLENVGKESKQKKVLCDAIQDGGLPLTFNEFYRRMYSKIISIRNNVLDCIALGVVDESRFDSKRQDSKVGGNNFGDVKGTKPAAKKVKTSNGLLCYGCGRDGHKGGECRFCDHPDFNGKVNGKEPVAWALSANGKKWAARGKTTLPWDATLSGVAYTAPPMPPKTAAAQPAATPQNKGGFKGGYRKGNDELLNTVVVSDHEEDVVIGTMSPLSSVSSSVVSSDALTVRCFIDNGALQNNYINEEAAQFLRERGVVGCACAKNKFVCSGFSNDCRASLGSLSFALTLTNEVTRTKETFELTASIIDSPFDIIIGRPDIKKYKFTKKFPSHFEESVSEDTSLLRAYHPKHNSNITPCDTS